MKGVTSLLLLVLLFLVSANLPKKEKAEVAPVIKDLKFGSITINEIVYEDDVVIKSGVVSKRKKSASKHLREKYGHTPITPAENIPWDCDTLIVGIGMSSQLPVTDDFKKEAKSKKVVLILLETPDAVAYFTKHYYSRMNAVFHITC